MTSTSDRSESIVMKRHQISVLLVVLGCTCSEAFGAQGWIADRMKAEKSLAKNDFVSARAELASSLTKVSKLPPPKEPKKIEPDILSLNRSFAKLWCLETRDVMAKSVQGGGQAVKDEYCKTMDNDSRVLLSISEKQLGKNAPELQQTIQTATVYEKILKQPYMGRALPPASAAVPGTRSGNAPGQAAAAARH
jgi:hypothetical protein